MARRTNVPIYLTEPTAGTLAWNKSAPKMEYFEAGGRLAIGDLDIDTFTVPHDAVDPVGFCVRRHGVKLAIATDLGYMTDSVRHHLRGADFLILESNHDLEMLKVGPYPWAVKQRVLSRDGHLSNQAAAQFLANDWDCRAQRIVLAHLSGNNNHPALAQMDAQQALDAVGSTATELSVRRARRPDGALSILSAPANSRPLAANMPQLVIAPSERTVLRSRYRRLGLAAGGFLRGGVVQLVRTPACHAGGREFESRRSRHSFSPTASACAFRGSRRTPGETPCREAAAPMPSTVGAGTPETVPLRRS